MSITACIFTVTQIPGLTSFPLTLTVKICKIPYHEIGTLNKVLKQYITIRKEDKNTEEELTPKTIQVGILK